MSRQHGVGGEMIFSWIDLYVRGWVSVSTRVDSSLEGQHVLLDSRAGVSYDFRFGDGSGNRMRWYSMGTLKISVFYRRCDTLYRVDKTPLLYNQ